MPSAPLRIRAVRVSRAQPSDWFDSAKPAATLLVVHAPRSNRRTSCRCWIASTTWRFGTSVGGIAPALRGGAMSILRRGHVFPAPPAP
jgi:hypothetical protein